MRILVTGAGGLLGSSFTSKFASKYEVYAVYHNHMPHNGIPVCLDLTNFGLLDMAVKKIEPDLILHAAALTDVDFCEREKDLAMKVNCEVSSRLAYLAMKHGAFMIYVSTDYVFDGTKGLYREDDEPNPINQYGLSKLKGETAVEKHLEQHCIVRTSVIYGSKPCGGKVNFALWLLNNLRKGEQVNILTDQYVSPTLSTNLADMINEIMYRGLTGIYHLSGATRVSRYEFALKLCDAFGLDHSLLKVITVKDMAWLAKRPMDSSLNVSKAMRTLNIKPLNIEDALVKFKGEMGS